MSTIELPDDVAARLEAEARRCGIGLDVLIAELAERFPAPSEASASDLDRTRSSRRLGFVSLGSSTTGRCAREADDMLADGFGTS